MQCHKLKGSIEDTPPEYPYAAVEQPLLSVARKQPEGHCTLQSSTTHACLAARKLCRHAAALMHYKRDA